jgi:FtsH-binding integral membrane protein
LHLTPRQLFLLDALGALLSAALLAGIVATWESVFGLPSRIPYALAAVAVCFAAYSFACWLRVRDGWRPWLLGIALANATYGVVTLAIIARHWSQLTRAGVAYFVLELVVLVVLIRWELRAATVRSA